MSVNSAYLGESVSRPVAERYDGIRPTDAARGVLGIAKYLPEGGRVLEVACGSGDEAIGLAKLVGFEVVGLDVSASMVRIASVKAQTARADVRFCEGDALHMPFPADAFDLVYCRAALRSFSDPVGAIREMHRVLKLGGLAIVDDVRPDLEHLVAETPFATCEPAEDEWGRSVEMWKHV